MPFSLPVTLLIVWLAVLNLAGLALMAADKSRARRGRWRVPEKTLFALALLLGAPGAYAGMMTFRHKTRHTRFRVGLPLLSAAQIILVAMALSGRL